MLVVGGGVAGIQASLDLAEAGFPVVLIERSLAIGGTMARVERIFPARECSMCLLSPKMVELKRHANIRLITMGRLNSLDGRPGNFTATVLREPVYVDAERCNNCGICAANCPVQAQPDHHGAYRRAVYGTLAGALPGAYVIDARRCLHLSAGSGFSGPGPRCGICAKICPVQAIDFGREQEVHILEAGAAILATGFEHFEPAVLNQYHWGEYPGVLTSLEFEHLTAGAPEGPLRRPGDQREVKRIAWIQCVGSRNEKTGYGYCSAVCCLNTAKEATLVRESWPRTECAVFYTDLRACGPDSERAFGAALEAGVRYERCRVGEVTALPGELQLRYVRSDSRVVAEAFDLVVLAVGLRPSRETMHLASMLGLGMNRWGFCAGQGPDLTAGRPGIYLAGGCRGPQDIAGSVTEGSAAAGQVAVFLSGVRPRPVVSSRRDAERDGRGQPVQVGVFVCHCGSNIGGVVDVPAVTAQAAGLDEVVTARELRFACSEEGQALIRQATVDHGLNRVVVAACTPRYHERVFAANLQAAGLNPSLLEMANIREHCSWVHRQDRPRATAKASAIVRRAVAKARLLTPLPVITVKVQSAALVIGGGAAGLTAALDLADQGVAVHLVEKSGRLGGRALEPGTCSGDDGLRQYVAGLAARVENHPAVKVYRPAVLRAVSGRPGDFAATVAMAGGETADIRYGVAIIAAGGREAVPGDHLYGAHPRVMTLTELSRALAGGDERIGAAETFAFILCAGSRRADQIPYCSMVCCSRSLDAAFAVRALKPGARILVLYRDMRTASFREEKYRRARAEGMLFIPYTAGAGPRVETAGESLRVSVREPILDVHLLLDVDVLILAPPVLPPAEAPELARLFKVPLNQDGFFQEVHGKLLPVDLPVDGVYVAGSAHGPRFTEDSITEGRAAAARAMKVLGRDTWRVVDAGARIREDLCSGCGMCVPLCPFDAISLDGAKRVAVIEELQCKGCGICAAACPQHACLVTNCTPEQVLAEIEALFG